MSGRAEPPLSGNLAGLLERSVRLHGSRPAIIDGADRITYEELDRRCAVAAGLLREHGVRPGDRVALLLPNRPEFVAAYYGALRLGAILVPINMLLRSGEVEYRLVDSGAKVLVTSPERAVELGPLTARLGIPAIDPTVVDDAELFDGAVEVDEDETAVIMYTSGTTGDAKGAELTHAGIRATALGLVRTFELTPDDVVFGAAALAHVLGQVAAMAMPLACGGAVALMQRFEAAAALSVLEETATTIFLGVPTMCIQLLQAAEGLPRVPQMRIAHVGGAPVPIETLHAFGARFGCQMLEGYGLSETAGTVTTHRLGRPIKPGSVGEPAEGTEVRIEREGGPDEAGREIGEVLVRSRGVMKGYWRNERATREALSPTGWFATGDVGYLDEDGYLFLVDRKKDVILRGGYTVYPREVEEALYAHPEVLEAVVLGIPHATLGEEVVAVVVPRRPACDAEQVKAFVRERVAAYKYPRLVVVVDELPHGPSGKIQRRQLDRDALRAQLEAAHALPGS